MAVMNPASVLITVRVITTGDCQKTSQKKKQTWRFGSRALLGISCFASGAQQLAGQSKLCRGPGGPLKGCCLGWAEPCCGVWGLCPRGLRYLGAAKDGVKVAKLENGGVDCGVEVMPMGSCLGHGGGEGVNLLETTAWLAVLA